MTKKEKENKTLTIVLVLISILAIGGMVYASIKLNEKKRNDDKYLVELNYKELHKKLDKKDSFILVVTRTDCSHCEAFKPKLKTILSDNKIYAYEIATDKLSKDDANKFKSEYNVSGTPTTIFIKDGSEVTVNNRLIGDVSSNKIVSRLKSLGFIK